ncbi:uncharacterized protein LOC128329060 isoform X4 [Hemicordylus capensis]|uniref:uncharacterized protein LOC128329060 isoform X4 n=1 Tax=Hemicordylus capensis TaxID=884348 RepID=UPI002303D59F|nr:uncharacterized protein LOC128329060 isoform X4 [Hemicordylus capensis]
MLAPGSPGGLLLCPRLSLPPSLPCTSMPGCQQGKGLCPPRPPRQEAGLPAASGREGGRRQGLFARGGGRRVGCVLLCLGWAGPEGESSRRRCCRHYHGCLGGPLATRRKAGRAGGPSRMGSRFVGCFPRGRRWRQRSKQGQKEAPDASSDRPEATSSRTRSTPSTSSETDPQSGRAYFSGKARVSFRHQLDSERETTN